MKLFFSFFMNGVFFAPLAIFFVFYFSFNGFPVFARVIIYPLANGTSHPY